jgi:hypothetical protein
MSSSPDREASRRPMIIKKLKTQIPILNLTAIIVRVAQFFLLGGLTLAYAMTDPYVFLDVFVWPQNAVPPYPMTVYRNSTEGRSGRTRQHEQLMLSWPVVQFQWNQTEKPAGLSEKYVCQKDSQWNCTGEQWAATRIGWLDSWPYSQFTPSWIAGTVHIDRYIFWLLLVGVCLFLSIVIFTNRCF